MEFKANSLCGLRRSRSGSLMRCFSGVYVTRCIEMPVVRDLSWGLWWTNKQTIQETGYGSVVSVYKPRSRSNRGNSHS